MSISQQHMPAHLAFVTGLRGLTALYVMLSHVWYQVWPAVPAPYGYALQPEGLAAWLTGWLYYGHFGVVVFIVLSGFCLMRPVIANGGQLPGGAATFLRRRALRILPPYYAALFLCLLLIHFWIGEKTGAQWDIALPVTPSGVLSHLFLLHDVIDSTQINYVFWTIAVEVQLYLVFPLLLRGWRQLGACRMTALFACVTWALILLLEHFEYRDIPPQFLGLPLYFIFGMGCATLTAHPHYRHARWGRVAALLGWIVAGLCLAWGHEVAEQRFAVLDALCALAACAALLKAAQGGVRNRIRTVLEQALLIRVGLMSYSLYLIHAPLLHLVWQYAIAPSYMRFEYQFLCLLVLGVPASCLGAYLFYLICERRSLPMRKRDMPCALGSQ